MKAIKSGINFLMLTRVTGLLVMIEAVFMLVPLVTAAIYGDGDLVPFAISAGITAGAGALMTFGVRPSRTNMGKREGFLLTAMVWVVFSLFGMLPFIISSAQLSVSDAFFESMSGFSTTGVSVIDDIDNLNHSIHMWRALMQWIGGMGIILFTLAVVPMLNSSGGMQMFNAEVTGITHEKLRPRVSSTAKRLWLIYGLLTILLIVLYWVGPMNAFDSICHAFSTMSTGGFSTRQESIASWDSLYVKIITTVFMFIGSVNFALIYKASTGRFGTVWQNQAFRAFVKLIAVLFIIFDVALWFNPEVPRTIESFTIDPLFQIVSAMSSTAYMANGFQHWGFLLLGLTFIMMFFGGCAGSTSGGAKIDRAIFLWKNSCNELKRCIRPNHVLSVQWNGAAVSPELLNKVLVFITIYLGVIVGGSLCLSALGVPLTDAFFSSLACVSNAGCELGMPGYGEAYSAVPDAGKWVLSFLMLTGRLELFTVLVLFLPSFWQK